VKKAGATSTFPSASANYAQNAILANNEPEVFLSFQNPRAGFKGGKKLLIALNFFAFADLSLLSVNECKNGIEKNLKRNIKVALKLCGFLGFCFVSVNEIKIGEKHRFRNEFLLYKRINLSF
jgi:hypothetical protein